MPKQEKKKKGTEVVPAKRGGDASWRWLCEWW